MVRVVQLANRAGTQFQINLVPELKLLTITLHCPSQLLSAHKWNDLQKAFRLLRGVLGGICHHRETSAASCEIPLGNEKKKKKLFKIEIWGEVPLS